MLRTIDKTQIPALSKEIYVAPLNGSEVQTLEAFYDRLEKLLYFPDYFGRNLDAFFDCITALENIDQPEVLLAIEEPGLFLQQEKPEKRNTVLQLLLDATLPENRYDGKKFSVLAVNSEIKTLVFATNNAHKAREIGLIIGNQYLIKTLTDIGCEEDIAETEDTLEGNALLKARYVKEHYGYDCFSEDTGLEVDALNGEPGVHTARYAGEQRSPEDNIRLLLQNLEGKNNRDARFRTIIALIRDGSEMLFEGVCDGMIHTEKRGIGGFGYDPVFIPSGYDQTFAELGDAVKSQISHRAKATFKLVEALR